jgi:hypothetical protein
MRWMAGNPSARPERVPMLLAPILAPFFTIGTYVLIVERYKDES